MRKYGNIPVECDGHHFDSKREARVYGELRLLLRAGQISGLEVHPPFPLVVDGVKVATYVADFAYFVDGKRVVVDVKSQPTKTPLYRLKIKLLKALYPGIDHREIF